jgi:hypothetical protein
MGQLFADFNDALLSAGELSQLQIIFPATTHSASNTFRRKTGPASCNLFAETDFVRQTRMCVN